jgi:hypothetical protein
MEGFVLGMVAVAVSAFFASPLVAGVFKWLFIV